MAGCTCAKPGETDPYCTIHGGSGANRTLDLPQRDNIRVADLLPGDVVRSPMLGLSAVFIAHCPHPLYPNLRLVIWRMSNPVAGYPQEWEHDALSELQVVGNADPSTPAQRTDALRWALLGGR